MSRLIPVLGIVLLTVGCASKQTRPASPDPFFGDLPNPPPATGKPTASVKEGTGKDASGKELTGKPEEPPTTNTTSPAEATNTSGVKLGNPRPAEVKAKTEGGPAPVPGTGAPVESDNVKPPPSNQTPQETVKVTPKETNNESSKEPGKETAISTTNTLTPAPSGNGISTVANREPAPQPPLSYEAVQKRLQERGVSWQQLQQVSKDRWHFICAIVDPESPGFRENFEVTRDGNMGLNAMQAVLEQIEKREKASPPPQAIRGGTRSDG